VVGATAVHRYRTPKVERRPFAWQVGAPKVGGTTERIGGFVPDEAAVLCVFEPLVSLVARVA